MKNKGSVAAYPANTRGTENPRRFEVPGRKGEREENTIKASSQKYKCMSLFSHMLLPAVPVFPDHFTHPHPHPHLHFFFDYVCIAAASLGDRWGAAPKPI